MLYTRNVYLKLTVLIMSTGLAVMLLADIFLLWSVDTIMGNIILLKRFFTLPAIVFDGPLFLLLMISINPQ